MAAKGKKDRPPRVPAMEWASAIAGLAIIGAMLGFLLLHALSARPHVPPLMKVETVRLISYDGGHVVEVRVRNESQQTAAAVQAEGVLTQDGRDVETSSVTLDYVPGLSQRRAGLIFRHDPRHLQLRLRITGYERP